ncbi:MAG: hypothetical protein V4539_09755 [Bacteroidota bacterium]
MKGLPKHITRFLTLVVAMQLLNLSIYAQDFKPLCQDDETNITETITEYVVEVLLGHKNAIPEQSQHHKDLHFHKHIAFKAISIFPMYHVPGLQQQNAALAVPLSEPYSYLYLQEINPPPPKA